MFATLKAKLLWLILTLAVAGGGYYTWKYQVRKELKTENTIVQQQVDIKILEDSAKLNTQSATLTEESRARTTDAIKTIVTEHKAEVQKLDTKEKAIEKKFADRPVTSDNQKGKSDELSAVRIDSLWRTYCGVAPQATGCTP